MNSIDLMFFGQFKCCTDSRFKDVSIEDTIGGGRVDMVHRWDDHCEIGSRAREVLRSMLKDLQCKRGQSQLV